MCLAQAPAMTAGADPVLELAQDRPQLLGERLRLLEVGGVGARDRLYRQSELLREPLRGTDQLRRAVPADEHPHRHAVGPDPVGVRQVRAALRRAVR